MQLHTESFRAHLAFIELNCAGITSEEMQSRLSGAGTVYLADVGALAPALQELVVNLYFRTSNAGAPGLFCGTSRELIQEVRTKRIRQDFYHLVSAITLHIPPLRFRKDEILDIAADLLTQYSRHFDRPRPELRDETVEFLLGHNWPGNLAELQTAIKTLVAIGDQSISLAALKAMPLNIKCNGHGTPVSLKEAARAASSEIERQLIAEVLCVTGGNRKRAADELGISYKALLYKLKQFEEDHPRPVNQNGDEL
jgi:two-component system, NtrC family, response regulator AtoC